MISQYKTIMVGENSDSIPIDLVLDISSRLPGKSIARFRCVSKLWGSMFHRPYFTELFLTRSWARPRLLFALKRDDEWSFLSSPQLQNPYGKSSLVVSADFHMKFPKKMLPEDFRGLTSGLMNFSNMRISEKNGDDAAPVIFNHRTQQYASLPNLTRHNKRSASFLGFDPTDKQFKVLSTAYDDHRILTLGTGEMSWRKIQCPLTHYEFPSGICINGVLYYLPVVYDVETDEVFHVIVCFDVRSEKFKFIEEKAWFGNAKLINYKGKLGGIYWKNSDGYGNILELCLWVLEDVEKQEWSNYVYTLPANEIVDRSNVSIVGVTATGEIVLSEKYTSKSKPFHVFYFNPERNTLLSVEIQGFGEYYDELWHEVSVFVDHVEDLNVNDAKFLKSSQGLNIIRQRPKLPKPKKIRNFAPSWTKNKQPTPLLLNKYELLENLEC